MLDLATEPTTFLGMVRRTGLGMQHKAAVAPATISDEPWAGTLSHLPGGREFYGLIERQAVITRAGFNRIPFARPATVQVSRPTGFKLAPGDPKPVSRAGLVSVTLEPNVVGSMLVLSTELLRNEDASAGAELAKQLSSAIISAANVALLDPDVAGSITNGIVPIAAPGDTDDALRDALVSLLSVGDAPVLIASLPWAVRIVAALHGADRLFPLLVAPEAGDNIIAVDPRGIAAALGSVEVTTSESATLQMRDDPAGGPTNLVSMYQTDSVAMRAQMFANWERVRDDAVAVLEMGAAS